jgi:hypothetical protein
MDQLFKALPSDLQWEILAEFVGTHAVRNGKLMRKLRLAMTFDQFTYTKRERPCYDWLCKHENEEENKRVFARFPSNGMKVMFCRDPNTDDTIYLYRKSVKLNSLWDSIWQAHFTSNRLDDSVILEPFIKHSYPPYPYTNKKMGRHAHNKLSTVA